jgi:hypothetical protein
MATRTGARTVALATALAVVGAGCSRQPQATPTPAPTSQPIAAPAADPKRCLVTIANGNGALWTALPPGGIDQGGTPEPDGSTSQKYLCYGSRRPLLGQRDLLPDQGLLAGHRQGRSHQPDVRGVHALSLD